MCRLLAEAFTTNLPVVEHAHQTSTCLPHRVTCTSGSDAVYDKVPSLSISAPHLGGRLLDLADLSVKISLMTEPPEVIAALATKSVGGRSFCNIDSGGPDTECSGKAGFFGEPIDVNIDVRR